MAKPKRRPVPKPTTAEALERLLPKTPSPRDPDASRRFWEKHYPGSGFELLARYEEALRPEDIRRELEAAPRRAVPRPGPIPAIGPEVWEDHVHRHPGPLAKKERARILSRQLGRRIKVSNVRNAERAAQKRAKKRGGW